MSTRQESVTYQAIVEEGEAIGEVKGMVKARQEDLLRFGRRRLGTPHPSVDIAVRSISDPDRLARLLDALWDAASWDELLRLQ